MSKKNIIFGVICLIVIIMICMVLKNNKNVDEEYENMNTIGNEGIREDGYGNYILVDENNTIIREDIPESMLDVYKAIPDFNPNPSY